MSRDGELWDSMKVIGERGRELEKVEDDGDMSLNSVGVYRLGGETAALVQGKLAGSEIVCSARISVGMCPRHIRLCR